MERPSVKLGYVVRSIQIFIPKTWKKFYDTLEKADRDAVREAGAKAMIEALKKHKGEEQNDGV